MASSLAKTGPTKFPWRHSRFVILAGANRAGPLLSKWNFHLKARPVPSSFVSSPSPVSVFPGELSKAAFFSFISSVLTLTHGPLVSRLWDRAWSHSTLERSRTKRYEAAKCQRREPTSLQLLAASSLCFGIDRPTFLAWASRFR